MKHVTIEAITAVVIIAFMILMFKWCQGNEERRIECVKAGRSPTECREAFR